MSLANEWFEFCRGIVRGMSGINNYERGRWP